MIRLPFAVAFGLWQKQRLEDLLRADPVAAAVYAAPPSKET